MGFCTNCGTAFKGAAKFCENCGTPRPVEKEPEKPKPVFCTSCGKPYKPEERFCTEDGTPRPGAAKSPTSASTSPTNNKPTPTPAPVVAIPAPARVAPTAPTPAAASSFKPTMARAVTSGASSFKAPTLDKPRTVMAVDSTVKGPVTPLILTSSTPPMRAVPSAPTASSSSYTAPTPPTGPPVPQPIQSTAASSHNSSHSPPTGPPTGPPPSIPSSSSSGAALNKAMAPSTTSSRSGAPTSFSRDDDTVSNYSTGTSHSSANSSGGGGGGGNVGSSSINNSSGSNLGSSTVSTSAFVPTSLPDTIPIAFRVFIPADLGGGFLTVKGSKSTTTRELKHDVLAKIRTTRSADESMMQENGYDLVKATANTAGTVLGENERVFVAFTGNDQMHVFLKSRVRHSVWDVAATQPSPAAPPFSQSSPSDTVSSASSSSSSSSSTNKAQTTASKQKKGGTLKASDSAAVSAALAKASSSSSSSSSSSHDDSHPALSTSSAPKHKKAMSAQLRVDKSITQAAANAGVAGAKAALQTSAPVKKATAAPGKMNISQRAPQSNAAGTAYEKPRDKLNLPDKSAFANARNAVASGLSNPGGGGVDGGGGAVEKKTPMPAPKKLVVPTALLNMHAAHRPSFDDMDLHHGDNTEEQAIDADAMMASDDGAPDAPPAPDAPEAPSAPSAPYYGGGGGGDAPEAPAAPDAPDAPEAPPAPDAPDVPDTPALPPSDSSRSGLLSAINGFKKGGLKKVKTVVKGERLGEGGTMPASGDSQASSPRGDGKYGAGGPAGMGGLFGPGGVPMLPSQRKKQQGK